MRRPTATAICVAALAVVAGCGSHTGQHAATASRTPAAEALGGRAVIGDLTITGAYVPEPASPNVAAAYITVHNSGRSADTLLRASTPAGGSTSLHRYVSASNGSEKMVPLLSMRIPAGRSAQMKPGGTHLMIEHPRPGLKQGGQIELTLVFQHAGRLTMQVPVVSPAGLNGGMPPGSSMPGM